MNDLYIFSIDSFLILFNYNKEDHIQIKLSFHFLKLDINSISNLYCMKKSFSKRKKLYLQNNLFS